MATNFFGIKAGPKYLKNRFDLSFDPGAFALPVQPEFGSRPEPTIPEAETESGPTPEEISALYRATPPSREVTLQRQLDEKPSLLKRILGVAIPAAGIGLGAAFGGAEGATGAAQGVERSLASQQATDQARRKELLTQLEGERNRTERTGLAQMSLAEKIAQMKQTAADRAATLGYNKDTLAETMRHNQAVESNALSGQNKPIVIPQGGILANPSTGTTIATGTEKPDKNTPVDQQEMSDWLSKNKGKGPSDFLKWKADQTRAPKEPKSVQMLVPSGNGSYQMKSFKEGDAIPAGAVTSTTASSLNAPTTNTRNMSEKAPRVINFIDRINSLLDDNEKQLGPLQSRWNEFTAGKIGLPNKGYTQLRTDIGLLTTALMNMHVGARGGEMIMQHFHDLIDQAKQSPENLSAALGEIKTYAQQVALEGGNQAMQQGNGANQPSKILPSSTPSPNIIRYDAKGNRVK
jgi:hypothetical protein